QPPVNRWTLREESFIQRADANGNPVGGSLGTEVAAAKPGERYVFVHRIINNGPDAVDDTITTWRSFNYPGSNNNRANEGTGGNGVGSGGTIRTIQQPTPVIPVTAAGQEYCSRAFA